MNKLIQTFGLLLLWAVPASGQGITVPSTPYTRDVLRSPDAATARERLGVVGTNALISVEQVVTHFEANVGLPIHFDGGVVGGNASYPTNVLRSTTAGVAGVSLKEWTNRTSTATSPAWHNQGAGAGAYLITNYNGIWHIHRVSAGTSPYTNTTLFGQYEVDDGTGAGPAPIIYADLDIYWFRASNLLVTNLAFANTNAAPGDTAVNVGITITNAANGKRIWLHGSVID